MIALGLRVAIGLVWLVNGLLCKVMHGVPRHEAIVSRILGETYAMEITKLIGLSEIGMAVWVWSGLYRKVNAWLQMVLVGTMNLLEVWLAPDLLLWGPWNLLFALGFIGVVAWANFGKHAI